MCLCALVSLCFLLSVPSSAFAQQAPNWEFFAGYSIERSTVREFYKSTPIIFTFRERYLNQDGWELSVTENVNRWFGGTFQATGHYKSSEALGSANRHRTHSIMYGPKFSHRMNWASPYGHVLFGINRSSVRVSPGPHAEETGFAVAAGLGLDVKLGSKMAARAFQLQYSPMNQVATKRHKFQASAGVVFYLGDTR